MVLSRDKPNCFLFRKVHQIGCIWSKLLNGCRMQYMAKYEAGGYVAGERRWGKNPESDTWFHRCRIWQQFCHRYILPFLFLGCVCGFSFPVGDWGTTNLRFYRHSYCVLHSFMKYINFWIENEELRMKNWEWWVVRYELKTLRVSALKSAQLCVKPKDQFRSFQSVQSGFHSSPKSEIAHPK